MKHAIDGDKLSLIYKLIYQTNGMLEQNINVDDSLINDLAMDSVEMIDLLMRLEEHGVVIAEAQITDALTVGQLAQMLPD